MKGMEQFEIFFVYVNRSLKVKGLWLKAEGGNVDEKICHIVNAFYGTGIWGL